MASETNPYEPPYESDPPPDQEPGRRRVLTSVLMVVVGISFCVASFFVIFGHGLDALTSTYRTLGTFPFAYMFFYGCAGGLTTLFHLSYLIRGWPQQHLAGLYAIGLALALTGLAAAIMEVVTQTPNLPPQH